MAGRAKKSSRVEIAGSRSGKLSRDTPSVTIIGLGNWGTALTLALHRAGISIAETVVRRGSKTGTSANSKLVRGLGARLTTLDRATLDADILWICTPDASIARVATEIAAQIQSNSSRSRHNDARSAPGHTTVRQIVFHSSGALASSELAALKTVGASVASVHPLMTFPRRRPSGFLRPDHSTAAPFSLAGVPFALQGEAAACRAARRLVRAVHGVPFLLKEHDKPLYHAFGAFTSPLLVALLTAAAETGAAAGLNAKEVRRLMRPIVERTIANFFSDGPDKSFSGPLARGDADTIARHLAALHTHTSVSNIYRQLSLYAVAALPGAGKNQLRKLLSMSPRKPASSRRAPASTA